MTQPDPSAQSGAPDQTGAQGGAAGGEGTEGTISTTDASGQSAAQTQAETPAETVSKADFDRLVNQLRAADQKRTAAEQQLQQLRDKDIPEMDRLKRDADALKAENERLKEQAKQNTVQLAFFKENTVRWHDPAAALQLTDMSGVVINDDGTVSGLRKALEDLAKAKPYLVDKGSPEQQDNAGNASNASTGGVPPMNGRSQTQKPTTSGLQTRLPALASRLGRRSSN